MIYGSLLTDTPEYFIVTDLICQTKWCLRTFSKATSHCYPVYARVLFLQAPWFGSLQKSTPDDILNNSLLQAKPMLLSAGLSLSKHVLWSGYTRSNFFFTGSVLCNEALKVVKLRFPQEKIVNSGSPGLLLIFIMHLGGLLNIDLHTIFFRRFLLSYWLKNVSYKL